MRILVADDDAATRRLVQKTLSKCDYEVLSCSDGSQAWERLKSDAPPELAVLDWKMPGVDGPELCPGSYLFSEQARGYDDNGRIGLGVVGEPHVVIRTGPHQQLDF